MSEQIQQRKPRLAILYHFMYPDDVVSAHHFDDLAASMAVRGWDVTAYPSNRGCRNENLRYPARDSHQDVTYRRVWRPATSQRPTLGRLFNSLWMILAWTRIAFQRKDKRPDVILVGTDPVFAVLVAIPLKLFQPSIKIAHWCFDLHPEAATVSGMKTESSLSVKVLKKLLANAYRNCSVVADLGSCMRQRLRQYNHASTEVEITPWALVEPAQPLPQDQQVRQSLFKNATLGLLYSGNYGEAHDMGTILKLARTLRTNSDIHFCFSVRGSKEQQLREQITEEDINITLSGFVPFELLDTHLGAADIHLASLREEWTGVAVPSKFLGSLAAGRPVLFSGASDCCISTWIERFNLGWLLNDSNIASVAEELVAVSKDRERLESLQVHSHQTYQAEFSKRAMNDRWDASLKLLLPSAGNV